MEISVEFDLAVGEALVLQLGGGFGGDPGRDIFNI